MKLLKIFRDNSYAVREVASVPNPIMYFKTRTTHISYNEYLDKLDKIKNTIGYENDENLRDGYIFIYKEVKHIKLIPRNQLLDATIVDGNVIIKDRDKEVIVSKETLNEKYIIYKEG